MAPPNKRPDPSTAGSNWEALKKEISVSAKKTHEIIRKPIGKQQRPQKGVNRFKAAHNEAVQKLRGGDGLVTEVLGLDCEYCGVGFNGNSDQLARVSVVNCDGKTVYDKYVRPKEEVTDYRTHVSGVRPGHLLNATPFDQVQQEVHKLLSNRVVVGHGLSNDFRVLNLTHPLRLTRDSATWKPLRKMVGCAGTPSLKLLAQKLLNISIQEGEHDSLIDAKTALRIYQLHKKRWDSDVKQKRK